MDKEHSPPQPSKKSRKKAVEAASHRNQSKQPGSSRTAHGGPKVSPMASHVKHTADPNNTGATTPQVPSGHRKLTKADVAEAMEKLFAKYQRTIQNTHPLPGPSMSTDFDMHTDSSSELEWSDDADATDFLEYKGNLDTTSSTKTDGDTEEEYSTGTKSMVDGGVGSDDEDVVQVDLDPVVEAKVRRRQKMAVVQQDEEDMMQVDEDLVVKTKSKKKQKKAAMVQEDVMMVDKDPAVKSKLKKRQKKVAVVQEDEEVMMAVDERQVKKSKMNGKVRAMGMMEEDMEDAPVGFKVGAVEYQYDWDSPIDYNVDSALAGDASRAEADEESTTGAALNSDAAAAEDDMDDSLFRNLDSPAVDIWLTPRTPKAGEHRGHSVGSSPEVLKKHVKCNYLVDWGNYSHAIATEWPMSKSPLDNIERGSGLELPFEPLPSQWHKQHPSKAPLKLVTYSCQPQSSCILAPSTSQYQLPDHYKHPPPPLNQEPSPPRELPVVTPSPQPNSLGLTKSSHIPSSNESEVEILLWELGKNVAPSLPGSLYYSRPCSNPLSKQQGAVVASAGSSSQLMLLTILNRKLQDGYLSGDLSPPREVNKLENLYRQTVKKTYGRK
ncbi:hypothetical protein CPB84DRAFT_1858914 [Gymnopilus junonius]|uniref:Uncharacterized protein n=1 Tax=Gymnopilus junonius TaxID=109634 RepID=A0A9P5N7H9_GYMJU|nr:hypothetical protein CPB84DRAFT_1858914 [Gymnopilus junonius]